jgi:hypothetical protein
MYPFYSHNPEYMAVFMPSLMRLFRHSSNIKIITSKIWDIDIIEGQTGEISR